MTETEKFRTERLVARPWRIEDLPLAMELWGDPAIIRRSLEAAATRAIEIGTLTYGSVRSILDNNLDRQAAQRPSANGVPILHPNIRPAWLGEEPVDVPQLKSLLAPYPSKEMICRPVSPRVGNVKNNDPGLVKPVTVP
jgi:hypothetical protein